MPFPFELKDGAILRRTVPVLREALSVCWQLSLLDLEQFSGAGSLSIERRLGLFWPHIAEVTIESLVVTPLHPAECREFEIINRSPRLLFHRSSHQFSFVISVHRFSERIIVTITNCSDRGLRARQSRQDFPRNAVT